MEKKKQSDTAKTKADTKVTDKIYKYVRDLKSTPHNAESTPAIMFKLEGKNSDKPWAPIVPFIRPITPRGIAANGSNKVFVGTAVGYTDCALYFATKLAATEFLKKIQKSIAFKNIKLTITKAQKNPYGYYKIGTEFGDAYISASKLTEAFNTEPNKGTENTKKLKILTSLDFSKKENTSMKIKKQSMNTRLTEAEIKDVETASVAEIADVVQDGIEAESKGEISISDAEATRTAEVVKKAAGKIDNVNLTIATKNALTDALDDALADALIAAEDGEITASNVLITGLPGSGKTGIVNNWAARQNPPVNLFYLDAKNNDLEAYINGYTMQDNTKPGENAITQGRSNNLDPLERPNSILFLDELNRQVDVSIRGSLYSLINEHVITGKDANGRHRFENLLFTIACINPVTQADKGASNLSDAELSRFGIALDFDSDKLTAADYFMKYFNKQLALLDPSDPKFREKFERYTKCKNLAIFIVKHSLFKFDSRSDLDDLAGAYDRPKTMLNLRSLTGVIKASKGDKDTFLRRVRTYSNFLPRDIKMFEEILRFYTDPVIDFSKMGLSSEETSAPVDNSGTTDEFTMDDLMKQAKTGKETDLFGAASSSKHVATPKEAASILSAAFD